MASGILSLSRSPYTPYSIYLRGTLSGRQRLSGRAMWATLHVHGACKGQCQEAQCTLSPKVTDRRTNCSQLIQVYDILYYAQRPRNTTYFGVFRSLETERQIAKKHPTYPMAPGSCRAARNCKGFREFHWGPVPAPVVCWVVWLLW